MHFMKPLLLLFLLHLVIAEAFTKVSCKIEGEDEDCSTITEYNSYMACMRRRNKRSLDCDTSCDDGDCESNECSDCDCNYCSYNDCASSCNSCCQNSPPPCQTRSCCYATCQTQCRTSNCRRNCRSKCTKSIATSGAQTGGTLGGSTSGKTESKTDIKNDLKHNITTVINLHNIINNTNVIDTPIYVNNTNVNNITLEAQEAAPQHINIENGTPNIPQPQPQPMPYPQPLPMPYPQPQPLPIPQPQPLPYPQTQPCCKIIGPRQCMQTSTYPYSKCFHYRKQYCGDICKTSIMHAEPHQVCDQVAHGTPKCHEQIAYIPQPQPKCSYTSAWPYVSCNIPSPNCGGCYSHIVQGGQPPKTCPNTCYDQGVNVGPLLRQGPVYQPSFGGMNMYGGMMPMGPYGMGGMGGMGGMVPSNVQFGNPMETGYQVQNLEGNVIPFGLNKVTENNLIGSDHINNVDAKAGFNPYPFDNAGGIPITSNISNKREAETDELNEDDDKKEN